MTKKSFETVDKKGRKTVWEWEETPELTEFIKKQTGTQLSARPTRPT